MASTGGNNAARIQMSAGNFDKAASFGTGSGISLSNQRQNALPRTERFDDRGLLVAALPRSRVQEMNKSPTFNQNLHADASGNTGSKLIGKSPPTARPPKGFVTASAQVKRREVSRKPNDDDDHSDEISTESLRTKKVVERQGSQTSTSRSPTKGRFVMDTATQGEKSRVSNVSNNDHYQTYLKAYREGRAKMKASASQIAGTKTQLAHSPTRFAENLRADGSYQRVSTSPNRSERARQLSSREHMGEALVSINGTIQTNYSVRSMWNVRNISQENSSLEPARPMPTASNLQVRSITSERPNSILPPERSNTIDSQRQGVSTPQKRFSSSDVSALRTQSSPNSHVETSSPPISDENQEGLSSMADEMEQISEQLAQILARQQGTDEADTLQEEARPQHLELKTQLPVGITGSSNARCNEMGEEKLKIEQDGLGDIGTPLKSRWNAIRQRVDARLSQNPERPATADESDGRVFADTSMNFKTPGRLEKVNISDYFERRAADERNELSRIPVQYSAGKDGLQDFEQSENANISPTLPSVQAELGFRQQQQGSTSASAFRADEREGEHVHSSSDVAVPPTSEEKAGEFTPLKIDGSSTFNAFDVQKSMISEEEMKIMGLAQRAVLVSDSSFHLNPTHSASGTQRGKCDNNSVQDDSASFAVPLGRNIHRDSFRNSIKDDLQQLRSELRQARMAKYASNIRHVAETDSSRQGNDTSSRTRASDDEGGFATPSDLASKLEEIALVEMRSSEGGSFAHGLECNESASKSGACDVEIRHNLRALSAPKQRLKDEIQRMRSQLDRARHGTRPRRVIPPLPRGDLPKDCAGSFSDDRNQGHADENSTWLASASVAPGLQNLCHVESSSRKSAPCGPASDSMESSGTHRASSGCGNNDDPVQHPMMHHRNTTRPQDSASCKPSDGRDFCTGESCGSMQQHIMEHASAFMPVQASSYSNLRTLISESAGHDESSRGLHHKQLEEHDRNDAVCEVLDIAEQARSSPGIKSGETAPLGSDAGKETLGMGDEAAVVGLRVAYGYMGTLAKVFIGLSLVTFVFGVFAPWGFPSWATAAVLAGCSAAHVRSHARNVDWYPTERHPHGLVGFVLAIYLASVLYFIAGVLSAQGAQAVGGLMGTPACLADSDMPPACTAAPVSPATGLTVNDTVRASCLAGMTSEAFAARLAGCQGWNMCGGTKVKMLSCTGLQGINTWIAFFAFSAALVLPAVTSWAYYMVDLRLRHVPRPGQTTTSKV